MKEALENFKKKHGIKVKRYFSDLIKEEEAKEFIAKNEKFRSYWYFSKLELLKELQCVKWKLQNLKNLLRVI